MVKNLSTSPVAEKTYDKAPAVVHANDLDIAKDVCYKLQRSHNRVQGGKGSKRRIEDIRAIRNNWDDIRWT
jgi:hypothetical protein